MMGEVIRGRGGEDGEPQRGSGCDMKYSDGGRKIQLNRARLIPCSTWLEEVVVVVEEEKGAGDGGDIEGKR